MKNAYEIIGTNQYVVDKIRTEDERYMFLLRKKKSKIEILTRKLNEKQEKDEILPNQNEKIEKIIENEPKEHTEKSKVEEIKQEPEIQQISKKVDSNLSSKTKSIEK